MMRHAEKRDRIASCPFADDIANLSIAAFSSVLRSEGSVAASSLDPLVEGAAQTVLAAILVSINKEKEKEEELRVVSLGVGTKVLQVDDAETRLDRIHDSHAEVLARRGLIRFLYGEIIKAFNNDEQENSIFQMIDGSGNNASASASAAATAAGSVCAAASPRFKLKEGISFHLYTSSTPCGNACVRRGGKPQNETQIIAQIGKENLSWKDFQNIHSGHPTFSRPLQEVAKLVKTVGISSSSSLTTEATKQTEDTSSKRSKKRHCLGPGWDDDGFIPPGMAFPGDSKRGATKFASCSDKIAKWCHLGIQGAMLTAFISEPILLQSITVGRKFSRVHLERAICCRVEGSFNMNIIHPESTDGKRRKTGEGVNTKITEKKGKARRIGFHHPAILCTSVLLHPGEVRVEEGAIFSDICMAWWVTSTTTKPEKGICEILSGTKGCLFEPSDSSSSSESSSNEATKIDQVSLISRIELLKLWEEAWQMSKQKMKESSEEPLKLSCSALKVCPLEERYMFAKNVASDPKYRERRNEFVEMQNIITSLCN